MHCNTDAVNPIAAIGPVGPSDAPLMFSVLIPTYNRVALLREALDSIFRQNYRNYEVIVVDDGSTDDTAEMVAAHGARIRYMRQDRRGVGAARQTAVVQAKGRYLAFLDSDDRWLPWTLSTFMHCIGYFKDPAMVMGHAHWFFNPADLLTVKQESLQAVRYDSYLAAAKVGTFTGGGLCAVRRDALLAVGGICEENMNATDIDMFLRLGLAAGYVQITAPVTLAYRRHALNATASPERSFTGLNYLFEQEKLGRYPGGVAKRRQREAILSRVLAFGAAEIRRQGRPDLCLELYRKIFRWQLAYGRGRFLLTEPFHCARALWRAAATGAVAVAGNSGRVPATAAE